MTEHRIVISDEARRLMGECVLFIAGDNPEAAEELRKRLVDSIRSLKTMPHRYPFFNEACIPKNKYHKLFVEWHCLILYQIKDETVYVDYVIDCRRDYKWLIR